MRKLGSEIVLSPEGDCSCKVPNNGTGVVRWMVSVVTGVLYCSLGGLPWTDGRRLCDKSEVAVAITSAARGLQSWTLLPGSGLLPIPVSN